MESSRQASQETYYIIKLGRNFVTRYESRPASPKLDFSLSNKIEYAQKFLIGLDSDDNKIRPSESEHIELERRHFLEAVGRTGGEIVKVTKDVSVVISYDLKEVRIHGDKIKFMPLTAEKN